MIKEKREMACLVPYKKEGGDLLFFMQKRDKDAARAPGVFGMFGGGMDEGESPKEGMLREVQEELTYTPVDARYFSRYETAIGIYHIFIEEVGGDFESKVKVNEGEYGKFLSLADMDQLTDISMTAHLVAEQMADKLITN